jgi:hypothetical protein
MQTEAYSPSKIHVQPYQKREPLNRIHKQLQLREKKQWTYEQTGGTKVYQMTPNRR